MNIDIGAKIRQLRLMKGMTQEQLAAKLSVSAQAVSKWENGATAPDIGLLPELSVIFGVTIDELFSMTDAARMERIDNMLYDVRFLPQGEFAQTESWLRLMQSDETLGARAMLLLARLYNKRADEYHALAAPLARRALELTPDAEDSAAHNAVFDAENGVYPDWNFVNHHKLIDFYKTVVERHPEDRKNYLWLLDILLADGRAAEAREYAERMRRLEHTYHYELYMGCICRAECDLTAALDWWRRMTEREPENWLVWASFGGELAKLARWDEAEACYRKAMPLRPKPRFIDCEEAVADLCEIQGDFAGAIEMRRACIELMKSDWYETEGEGVDLHLREIERLKKRMEG